MSQRTAVIISLLANFDPTSLKISLCRKIRPRRLLEQFLLSETRLITSSFDCARVMKEKVDVIVIYLTYKKNKLQTSSSFKGPPAVVVATMKAFLAFNDAEISIFLFASSEIPSVETFLSKRLCIEMGRSRGSSGKWEEQVS